MAESRFRNNTRVQSLPTTIFGKGNRIISQQAKTGNQMSDNITHYHIVNSKEFEELYKQINEVRAAVKTIEKFEENNSVKTNIDFAKGSIRMWDKIFSLIINPPAQ